MVYRNKTFVSFDGDSDIHYYRLMLAWRNNQNIDFGFYDAHDLIQSRDSSSEQSIKESLRHRLANAKIFVLLIGESTRYLYKFVKWEIEQAVNRDLPIVCVNLNGVRRMDEERCPPILKKQLAVHVSFNAAIVQYSIDNWPRLHDDYRSQGKIGPYYMKPEVYSELSL